MLSIKAKDLSLDAIKGYRLFSVYGDDQYYLKKVENFFVSLVDPDMADFNLKILDNLTDAVELKDAVQAYPSFSDVTVVIVRDREKKKELDKKVVAEVLNNIPEWCYLVAINAGFVSASDNLSMADISAERLKANEMQQEVKNLFADYGGISLPAVTKLIQYTNRDMGRIERERDKLTAYAAGKEITPDYIEQLVVPDSEHRIYEFTNAIVDGRKNEANQILSRLLKQGESGAHLLSSLLTQYRRLFYSACSKESNLELAKKFGVKEYAVTKLRESAGRYKPMAIRNAINFLSEVEFRNRKGELSDTIAFDSAINYLLSM